MSSIEKTPETRKKACLAVVCNGWKECESGWCDASGWCEFHPDHKEYKESSLIRITGCKPKSLGIKGDIIWSGIDDR